MKRRIFKLFAFAAILLCGLLFFSPGFVGTGLAIIDTLLLEVEAPPSNQVANDEIILFAENSDGHDPAWEKRYYYGLRSWGIRGSGKAESGQIWFNSFPGATGEYEIVLKAVLEHDGSPPLKLSANDLTLYEGNLPYHDGHLDCEKRGAPAERSLGVHPIASGAKISIWAESTYECGEKGAYMLWEKLIFRPID